MAMNDSKLTVERLRELLHYDPDTGIFTWVERVSRRGPIGHIAGSKTMFGYCNITINFTHFMAHRLAWLYVHGEWPKHYIDHINGDRFDNRFCNLREATRSENGQNRCLSKNSTSGFMGVTFCPVGGNWVSHICINKKLKHLGYFDTPELAHEAYKQAKAELHTFNPVSR